MKTKLVALLLCIILCLGLCVPALGAYNDDVTVSATLDQTKLSYDADNDRTVTLTVTLSKTVGLYSVYYVADVPKELTLSGLTSDITSLSYSLDTGIVSWFDMQGKNVDTTNLAFSPLPSPLERQEPSRSALRKSSWQPLGRTTIKTGWRVKALTPPSSSRTPRRLLTLSHSMLAAAVDP